MESLQRHIRERVSTLETQLLSELRLKDTEVSAITEAVERALAERGVLKKGGDKGGKGKKKRKTSGSGRRSSSARKGSVDQSSGARHSSTDRG